MAKEMRPGQRNNLDALCRHFGIDNSKRTLHGALLDAELLADVYMAMTRGQESLMMDLAQESIVEQDLSVDVGARSMKVLVASSDELNAHQEYIQGLNKNGDCVWQSLEGATQEGELG
jgi:DNA polymerase-3 subunit epsilon